MWRRLVHSSENGSVSPDKKLALMRFSERTKYIASAPSDFLYVELWDTRFRPAKVFWKTVL